MDEPLTFNQQKPDRYRTKAFLIERKKNKGYSFRSRIEKLKQLIEEGNEVVLWSAGGREYAETFANQFGIKAVACLGKPDICVDDNPNIRPSRKMPIKSPEVFFGS